MLAALDMRAALAGYNAQLRAQSLPELAFGIGIHSGDVIVGVMGAGELNKFTVTGDPINVASRVEGLTRDFRVDLLVTEEVRSARRGLPPAADGAGASRASPSRFRPSTWSATPRRVLRLCPYACFSARSRTGMSGRIQRPGRPDRHTRCAYSARLIPVTVTIRPNFACSAIRIGILQRGGNLC